MNINPLHTASGYELDALARERGVARRAHESDAALRARTPANTAVAAIVFATQNAEGLEFLRVWLHGDWDAIRREWPEAPESVYVKSQQLPTL